MALVPKPPLRIILLFKYKERKTMNAEELLAEVRELVISVGGPQGGSLAVMVSDILGITDEEVNAYAEEHWYENEENDEFTER